ncbi:BPSL0067 family protein [Pseudoalteromonas shioyasakiensis]|uniref:BPSL0067 family protein n=1 Tax=Pseudoalteromonas shioyasakiensis TaxID=1190813 RepID=UPI001EFDE6F6|nr:BPSL0067 family protein [Pseudoalteromonas shioyasakiensis]
MPRTDGYRSYIDVDRIVTENDKLVSTGSCAALVQYYTKVGVTSGWVAGEEVLGSKIIKRGTAIATFVNGDYPNLPSGNHAALFVEQNDTSITVVDQWEALQKPHKRVIYKKGKNSDGTFKDPSNNAEAFSIIKLKSN